MSISPRASALSLAVACACLCPAVPAQEAAPASGAGPSVARAWTEAALYAIRRDFARPPVHARNLYHLAAAMYDAWAVLDATASPAFLGVPGAPEACRIDPAELDAFRAAAVSDPAVAREVAVGRAAVRVLRRRFANAASTAESFARFDELAAEQGLAGAIDDPASPDALGARAADCTLAAGLADGANEAGNYANSAYASVNPPLNPTLPGNPGLQDPNRWQPLAFETFVDQSGNVSSATEFVGAEWGRVTPFALAPETRTTVLRDGEPQPVWLDPGPPPMLGEDLDANAAYAANHALVALWSAHLDPADGVEIDISPGALGQAVPGAELATDPLAQLALYDALDGGTASEGHALNPYTGAPYAPNLVARGDFTRVLAEFWADGPDSETPPGHWFRIYNEQVAAHPALERRVGGEGAPVDPLEFDLRVYLALGGAMHDAAVAAWSAKGAYDYVRPISAIRYLAERGQRTEPSAPNASAQGLPLVPGRIETVGAGDPLAGPNAEHAGKIKVFAWRGPEAVEDPAADVAGVGWILAERWWPYQRPDFVTPPFAGYVSGHSTFSRAAAEVLEALTGDAFFPGGLAEFVAPAEEFLVFERGPSREVRLQWATYRDAADQTSLSRIWGGIHPPADDLPGRRMGAEVGRLAAERSNALFAGGGESEIGGARVKVGVGCSVAGPEGGGTVLAGLATLALLGAARRSRVRETRRRPARGRARRFGVGDRRRGQPTAIVFGNAGTIDEAALLSSGPTQNVIAPSTAQTQTSRAPCSK